jgi:hypothetical protein
MGAIFPALSPACRLRATAAAARRSAPTRAHPVDPVTCITVVSWPICASRLGWIFCLANNTAQDFVCVVWSRRGGACRVLAGRLSCSGIEVTALRKPCRSAKSAVYPIISRCGTRRRSKRWCRAACAAEADALCQAASDNQWALIKLNDSRHARHVAVLR